MDRTTRRQPPFGSPAAPWWRDHGGAIPGHPASDSYAFSGESVGLVTAGAVDLAFPVTKSPTGCTLKQAAGPATGWSEVPPMNPPTERQPEAPPELPTAVPAMPTSARTSRPVSGRPADLLPGHRLVTITLADEELWAACEAFVYEMYVSIGYTEPSPRHRVEELAAWAEVSRFHAVLDENDRVVGTVRTIFGKYAQLPVSQFERTDHRDPDPVCELSSLVVDPHQRSTGVIEHLYRAGWLDAWREGNQALVALIDDWLFEAFVDTYRLPFRKIGIGQHYMGSDPVPVSLPLKGRHYLDLARDNPGFWAWTLEALTATEVRDWGLPIVLVDTDTAVSSDPATSARPTT